VYKRQERDCRGDKGHVVINAGEDPIEVSVATGLAPGEYCNFIASGTAPCVEPEIRVSAEGSFQAQLDPMTALAILRPR